METMPFKIQPHLFCFYNSAKNRAATARRAVKKARTMVVKAGFDNSLLWWRKLRSSVLNV